MRLVRSLAAWAIVSVVFIGGCAAPTEALDPAQGRKQLEQALDVPQDRALIAVYMPVGEDNYPQVTRSYELIRSGLFAIAVNEFSSHRGFSNRRFYTLLPGRYTLTATMQAKPKGSSQYVTTTQTIEIDLKAGERRLYKWVDYKKRLLEPVPVAAARNDETLLTRKMPMIRMDKEQLRHHNNHLKNPNKSNIALGSQCLPDPLKLRWDNARFEGKVRDCLHIQQGSLTYDDGHSARFGHVRDERGKIGAWISIQNNRYIIHPIAYKALYRAQINSNERYRYKIERHSGDGHELVAIDGVQLAQARPDVNQVIEMLAGKHGSKVTLTFNHSDSSSKVVVIRSNEYFEGLITRRKIDSQIAYPDGRRYTGPTSFDPAEEGELPLARPRDSASAKLKALNLHGQLIHADGRGFIGQFYKGLPSGEGYCFKGDRGEPCSYRVNASSNTSHQIYRGEEELETSGYSYRSAATIRADFDNLSHSAVIELLRKRWVDALLAEDWTTYLVHMTELQTLGFDTGMESIFYEARALQANGNTELAHDRVQNYINLAGSGGANYAEALDLYTRLEGPARQARQQRLARIAQARKQRRAFCEKLIEQGTLLCGCREFRGQLKGADARQCKS